MDKDNIIEAFLQVTSEDIKINVFMRFKLLQAGTNEQFLLIQTEVFCESKTSLNVLLFRA